MAKTVKRLWDLPHSSVLDEAQKRIEKVGGVFSIRGQRLNRYVHLYYKKKFNLKVWFCEGRWESAIIELESKIWVIEKEYLRERIENESDYAG